MPHNQHNQHDLGNVNCEICDGAGRRLKWWIAVSRTLTSRDEQDFENCVACQATGLNAERRLLMAIYDLVRTEPKEPFSEWARAILHR